MTVFNGSVVEVPELNLSQSLYIFLNVLNIHCFFVIQWQLFRYLTAYHSFFFSLWFTVFNIAFIVQIYNWKLISDCKLTLHYRNIYNYRNIYKWVRYFPKKILYSQNSAWNSLLQRCVNKLNSSLLKELYTKFDLVL